MKRPLPSESLLKDRILSTGEIRRLVRLMRLALGEPFNTVAAQQGWSMEDWFRMHSLAYRVRSERDRHMLTRKAAAARLRVPQYRLVPIEEGHVHNFEPLLFWRYVDLLGQREWVHGWISANRTLARRLGINKHRNVGSAGGNSPARHSNSALHPAARRWRSGRLQRDDGRRRG